MSVWSWSDLRLVGPRSATRGHADPRAADPKPNNTCPRLKINTIFIVVLDQVIFWIDLVNPDRQ